jgi:hypothetical protein
MTASFAQVQPARSGPTPAAAISVAIVAGVSVLTLIGAGITFFALAVAFPIAAQVAEAYNLPVSATDLAIAARFAELWWAFVALAFASFASAIVVMVKVISFLSPAPRD